MKKNRLIVLLLVLFTGGLIFWACQREEVDIPLDNTGNSELSSMLKGIYLPDVRTAIQWYSEHWQYTPLGRGMTGEHPLFKNMVPMWRYAYACRKGDLVAVEVPLQAESYSVFTLPENAIAYDATKDSRYINSLTRLVILTDKKTGKTKGFFMTQTPTKEYMDAKKFDVYRSVYLFRQEDFSGYIYFHYLDGTFANGWRYSDGRITHSVRPVTQEEESASLSRAGGYYEVSYYCYPVYRVVVTGYYEINEQGEEVFVEVHRYEEYAGEHCEVDVIWIPKEPEITDPENPGSGGIVEPEDECPYGTRGCPGGHNCTCCRICEGPCIVVPCPVCEMRHCTAVHIDCDKADDQCKAITNELLEDINFAVSFGEETMVYKEFLSKFAAKPELEHSIALNKEWDVNQGEQVNTLAFYHQGTPDSVSMVYSKLTHAVIHTHPISSDHSVVNILPPSAKDVYNLAETVVKEEVKSDGATGYTYLNLKTSYILTEGYTFAITVTDRKKAAAFLRNNPNFVGSDAGFVRGTDVGDRYYDSREKLGRMYSGVELDIYSLAYALQKSDAGVRLLYKKNGEQVFTFVKTMDASSEVIAVFHCK